MFFYFRLTYTRPSSHSSRPRRDWSRWRLNPNRSWTDCRNYGARWGEGGGGGWSIKMQNPWSEQNKDICHSSCVPPLQHQLYFPQQCCGYGLCGVVLAASAVFALFSLLSNCRSGFTSVIHNTSVAVVSSAPRAKMENFLNPSKSWYWTDWLTDIIITKTDWLI